MTFLRDLLYGALAAASFLYYYVKRSLAYWKERGILHEKPAFLWGNLRAVGFGKRHVHTSLLGAYEKYKSKAPFIGFYAFLKPMVLILDLDLVHHILRINADYFREGDLYCSPMRALQAGSNKCHNNLRNLPTQTIDGLVPEFSRIAGKFANTLKTIVQTDRQHNISELMDCYSIDVISDLVFGLGNESLKQKNTEFQQMAHGFTLKTNLLTTSLILNYPILSIFLQNKRINEKSCDYFLKLINSKIAERTRNSVHQRRNDFLNIVIADRSIERPNEDIAEQLLSFISVGLEACNSTLAFCLYELALQPELQHKARAEINAALGDGADSQLNVDALGKMNFIKQILYETLRKHSPYPFLLRSTAKEFEVPNSIFMLQENNEIVIPVSAIHHDPNIYEEPDRFNPDRFEISEVKGRHPMSWLAFGAGSRDCVAKYFTELQMLVALVMLLKHFEFAPCEETQIPIRYDTTKITLTPQTDIKLNIKRI